LNLVFFTVAKDGSTNYWDTPEKTLPDLFRVLVAAARAIGIETKNRVLQSGDDRQDPGNFQNQHNQ